MTDEFLTKGLQNDRYLKSVRLAEQFEASIESELRRVGEKMIAENPELFRDGVNGNMSYGRSSGSTLAYMRIDYPMDQIQDQHSDAWLTLNVHLYWCNPEQYNRTDVDSALRAFGYKIKNVNSDGEERVAAQTRDWDLHTADDPYSSLVVFYKHVSSAEEIEQAGETLVEHFSTFGSEYGVASDK